MTIESSSEPTIYMSYADVAKRWAMSGDGAVRKLVKLGKLNGVVLGREVRILRSEVEAYEVSAQNNTKENV